MKEIAKNIKEKLVQEKLKINTPKILMFEPIQGASAGWEIRLFRPAQLNKETRNFFL